MLKGLNRLTNLESKALALALCYLELNHAIRDFQKNNIPIQKKPFLDETTRLI